MKRSLFFLIMATGLLCSCLTSSPTSAIANKQNEWIMIYHDSLHKDSVEVNYLSLFDHSRNRSIPVALYAPNSLANKQTLVVFSHGYAEKKESSNTAYTYLTAYLAANGYMVASIQHDVPGDEALPMTGNLQENRMPHWERGSQNIYYVFLELIKRFPNLSEKKIIVIGHSHGGDISMLFASQYPQKTAKAISLDNLRMPLPKTDKPRIYSLRAYDMTADMGVLPSLKDQADHAITIVSLPSTKHEEMTDETASEEQEKEIREYVLKFLNESIVR